MWQPSSSQQNPGGSKIPISVLKNFNPYEILEPEKVSHKEQKLINIEPDEPEILTAAADVNVLLPKINPDLIDLFENIYVTPQHIEKKKEMDLKIQEEMEHNIRQITECSKNDTQSGKIDMCRNCLNNINNLEVNDAPKVLVPPKLKLTTNPTKINEYMIDGKVGSNHFVLLRNENVNTYQNVTKSFYSDSNNLLPPTNDDLEDHEELMDEILQTKSYEIYLKEQNETRTQNTSFQILKIHSNIEILKPSQNNDNIGLTNLIKNINNENLNTTKNVKLLDTVKKDEKLYLKKRIIKSDAMKSGYTKGPDLQEKSIVLPQLMERLQERKKVLEERKVVKRRLVLDTGSSTNNLVSQKEKSNHTPSLLNPVVLMDDCNRQRIMGFKTREKFENFVRTGQL